MTYYPLFSVLYPHLSTTSVRQFSRVVLGLLAMTGQVTHAEHLPLDVRRGELRDGPTLFQHGYPLGECILGIFQQVSAGS